MGPFDLDPHFFRVDARGRAYADDKLIRVHPQIQALRGPRPVKDPQALREGLQALQPLFLLELRLSPILVIVGKEELLAVWNVHLFEAVYVLRPQILYYREVPADNPEVITAMIHSQAYIVPLLQALNSNHDQLLATHLSGRNQTIVLALEGWQLPLTAILQKHIAAFLHLGRSGVSMIKGRISPTAKPTTGGAGNQSKPRSNDVRNNQDRPDADRVKPGSSTDSPSMPGAPVAGPDRPPAETTPPPAPADAPQLIATSDADVGVRPASEKGAPASDVPLHDFPPPKPDQSTPPEPEPTTPLVRSEGMLFAFPPPDPKTRRSRKRQAYQTKPDTGWTDTPSSDTFKKAS